MICDISRQTKYNSFLRGEHYLFHSTSEKLQKVGSSISLQPGGQGCVPGPQGMGDSGCKEMLLQTLFYYFDIEWKK